MDETPTESPAPPRRPGLGLSLAAAVALLVGWNAFAADLGARNQKGWIRTERFWADGTEGTALGRVFAELPPATLDRVLVLGSSQMKVVKGQPGGRTVSVGAQLGKALPEVEVIDLAAGGQQTVESLVLLAEALARVRPRAVLLGVGGFSMGRTSIRDRLAIQATRIDALEGSLVRGGPALREALAPVLANTSSGPDRPVRKTLQSRMDDVVSHWLAAVPAFRFRSLLYDTLVDEPLRRDLMGWLTRHFTTVRTARAYPLANAYPTALAAVDAMAWLCQQARVPFIVVALPFDHVREPIVYEPDDVARISADLAAIDGLTFVDLTGLLGPERFGDYVDGSRDALHFDQEGHALVAAALAPTLREALQAPGTD